MNKSGVSRWACQSSTSLLLFPPFGTATPAPPIRPTPLELEYWQIEKV
jgi:hypothetical protein